MKTKTMKEIRDAEARKYNATKFGSKIDFKAGFDCRDKLDNEELTNVKLALRIAREVMSTYDDKAVYDCQIEIQKLNEALRISVEALEFYKREHKHWKSHIFEQNKAEKALAEIRKLKGDI